MESITWRGNVTVRGKAREVELRFYPGEGCWQLFEWRRGKVVRLGVRGLVTEVLSVAAADLLCKAMAQTPVAPQPFDRSFSTRYRSLLARAAKLRRKSDGDMLSKTDRKRYHRVLDELQGYEVREDKWQGRGSLLSMMADHQRQLLRTLEKLASKAERNATKDKKDKVTA